VKYRKTKPAQQPWNWYAVNEAINKVSISYTPRPDATPQAELFALMQIYKFVLETKKAVEPAPEPDGRNDYARLANKERRPA
jgi:hypothetical protein